MRINEVIQEVDLSKRAIKYYEEQGLLLVAKDANGYRNYSAENINALKTISVYRKLGISIEDIRTLMKKQDFSILHQILDEKKKNLETSFNEIEALKQFISDHDINPIYDIIDYHTIADALQDAIPGFTGYYFVSHFLPYLQIKMETEEQREACHAIIEFWDQTNIRLPITMKISGWLIYRLMPKPSIDKMIKKMDQTIALYTHPTTEQYEHLKAQVLQGVKIKNNPLYKYSPAGIAQRRFMKELQNKGYNDIFIPNMIKLSPKYKTYHEALTKINQRICNELNLYYDTDFHLIQKK